MAQHPLVLQLGDAPDIEQFLAERIYEFNASATGYRDGESFSLTQQGDSGEIYAGASGYTWGGCCYIEYLWIEASRRGQGIGAMLLEAVEAHARGRSCSIVLVASHSFQSPGFYERFGFEQQAVVNDHPPGHTNVILAKRLGLTSCDNSP